jgi:hypothetical protein
MSDPPKKTHPIVTHTASSAKAVKSPSKAQVMKYLAAQVKMATTAKQYAAKLSMAGAKWLLMTPRRSPVVFTTKAATTEDNRLRLSTKYRSSTPAQRKYAGSVHPQDQQLIKGFNQHQRNHSNGTSVNRSDQ